VATHGPAGAAARHDDLSNVATRTLFGVGTGIANTVYGTIVVMATLTAAYANEHDPWRLTIIVVSTAAVLWVAHVYSHALSRTITDARPNFATVRRLALSELGILLAAAPPAAALVLGAAGVVRESRAVWLALATGLTVLAAEGVRYARLERFGRMRAAAAGSINLGLGLIVIGLKVAVAHR
jgi:hypothetical protein